MVQGTAASPSGRPHLLEAAIASRKRSSPHGVRGKPWSRFLRFLIRPSHSGGRDRRRASRTAMASPKRGNRVGGGQVLVVTHGLGRVRSRDGNGGVSATRDVVHIAPSEEHWHGAEPDKYLLPLAMSLGQAKWLREVTDEQYRRGFE